MRSSTCVPVVAKHAFREWKLPAALTGDGKRFRSLTRSISSPRSFGTATTCGALDADSFQFENLVFTVEETSPLRSGL